MSTTTTPGSATAEFEGLLGRSARSFGARIAVVSPRSRLSFAELHSGATFVRSRLDDLSGTRPALVAVRLDGSVFDVVAIYGALLAGAHVLALDSALANAVVRHLAPDAVIQGRRIRRGPLPGARPAVLRNLSPHVFVGSSGSTGQAVLTGFGLTRVLEHASSEAIQINSADVAALGGTIGSFSGIALALATVERGAALAFTSTASTSAGDVAHRLRALDVTRWSGPATLLSALALRWAIEGAPHRLRWINVRGEELSPALARAVLRARPGAELWHTYGLTESGQGCSWRVAAHELPLRAFVPIGSTMLDPHIVVDRGQIVVADSRPPALVFTARDHTARSGTAVQRLATGDHGVIHPDGAIEYCGRMGETLGPADRAMLTSVAARAVMQAFPKLHAVGVAHAGALCISSDGSQDAHMRAVGRGLGFPIVRSEDPPRLASGKLDRQASAALLR